MARLSAGEMRKVLDFVGEAHGAGDLEELQAYVPSGLGALIRTDYASYNEVGVDGTVHVAIATPEIPPELVAEWQRYAYQNPLAAEGVAPTREK